MRPPVSAQLLFAGSRTVLCSRGFLQVEGCPRCLRVLQPRASKVGSEGWHLESFIRSGRGGKRNRCREVSVTKVEQSNCRGLAAAPSRPRCMGEAGEKMCYSIGSGAGQACGTGAARLRSPGTTNLCGTEQGNRGRLCETRGGRGCTHKHAVGVWGRIRGTRSRHGCSTGYGVW